jgi:hypothetical protein
MPLRCSEISIKAILSRTEGGNRAQQSGGTNPKKDGDFFGKTIPEKLGQVGGTNNENEEERMPYHNSVDKCIYKCNIQSI